MTHSDLADRASDLCASLGTFFELAEREIKEHNSTDFDNIEFLVNGARSELFRFSDFVARENEPGEPVVTGTTQESAPSMPNQKRGSAPADDIYHGLVHLASLAHLLADADVDNLTGAEISAASALCQKAGALLERGTRAALGIPSPGIVGDPSDWLSLGH